jgi:hypothetical protein
MELTMKKAVIPAVMAVAVFLVSAPASANMMSCSGDGMSKMATMLGGMPDGPHKWEMYKHLAMVNAAMAKDGTRGCEMMMMNMMKGSKMSMMKSKMN